MSFATAIRRGLLLLSGVAIVHCATLDPLTPNTCGNGVVDANEDCDSFPSNCGAPTAATKACRLTCSKSVPCPDGWGCGIDGVCRLPTGSFEPPTEPLSIGVSTMIVGDFDGDGRTDIVGSGVPGANNGARARVHFFDDASKLATVVPIQTPIASPVVKDLDKNGRDDLTFGYLGFGVMMGQADRSFAPALYPTLTYPNVRLAPLVIEANPTHSATLPDGQVADFMLFIHTEVAGKEANAVVAGSGTGYVHATPFSPDQIVGQPVWGPVFDASPSTTCGEVVVGVNTAAGSTVYVYSPCEGKGWASAKEPLVVPMTKKITGVLLAKVGADSHLDVVVGTAEGHVVLHNDDGLTLKPAAPFQLVDASAATSRIEELPLAAADLNGDGSTDYVVPSGLYLSEKRIPDGPAPQNPFFAYRFFPTGRRSPWTTARIGLLNGDGCLDVVAASADQPDVDFIAFTGTPTAIATCPLTTQLTLTTLGPVPVLSVGDLDGDLIGDVAFIQTRPSGDNELAIAYGKTAGLPDAAKSVGRVTNVVRIDALAGNAGEAPKSLALFSSDLAAGSTLPTVSLTVLAGSVDRQPLAPLLLLDDASLTKADVKTTREWNALGVAVGAFQEPGRVDLVSLAVGYAFDANTNRRLRDKDVTSIWQALGSGGANFKAPSESLRLPNLQLIEPSTQAFMAATATGDLDATRDGVDELILLTNATDRSGNAALHVLRPRAGGLVSIPVGDEPITPTSRVGLVDVDGDDKLDAVVITGRKDKVVLRVFFNDGAGGFVKTPLDAIIPPAPGGGDTTPTGFSRVVVSGANAKGEGKRGSLLAVVTLKRLLLGELAPGRSKLTFIDLGAQVAAATLGEATSVVTGDFDGDGVEDLAVADSGSIRILRQKPRLK